MMRWSWSGCRSDWENRRVNDHGEISDPYTSTGGQGNRGSGEEQTEGRRPDLSKCDYLHG